MARGEGRDPAYGHVYQADFLGIMHCVTNTIRRPSL